MTTSTPPAWHWLDECSVPTQIYQHMTSETPRDLKAEGCAADKLRGVKVEPCPDMPCVGCPRTFTYPEKRAARCPVCNGSGSLSVAPDWTSSACTYSKTCHGCGGKGWVTL